MTIAIEVVMMEKARPADSVRRKPKIHRLRLRKIRLRRLGRMK
jgi:hypothetical protein